MQWHGVRVRALRLTLRYSQQEFAEYLGASTKSVRNWESDKHGPLPVNQRALDTAYERLASNDREQFWQLEVRSDRPDADMRQSQAGFQLRRSGLQSTDDWHLLLPEGRTLGVSSLPLETHHVTHRDGEYVRVRLSDKSLARRSPQLQRGLIVGIQESDQGARLFAMDALQCRRRSTLREELRIPRAYELDDFTHAILWATAGFDDGLLADDALLARARSDLHTYESLTKSAVSKEVVAELHPVSHMWLGSSFCAQHILRHLDKLGRPPQFWTAERRGEEASTWLLFRHKHNYLRKVQAFYGEAARLTRSFCIPEAAVTKSSRPERVLLFLAMALMEALSIEVRITTDPAFESLGGFVLAPEERAVVANWVRADGLWHVDSTTRRDLLREFEEATGHVAGHSVTTAETGAGRLQQVAAYLGLDWKWLARRCAEFSKYGAGGLLTPHSRLLSPIGLETACEYVGASSTLAAAR